MSKLTDEVAKTVQWLTSELQGSDDERPPITTLIDITDKINNRVHKNTEALFPDRKMELLEAVHLLLLLNQITPGQALKFIRVKILAISQERYARLVNVSRKTISCIENDKTEIGEATINKVFKPLRMKMGLVPVSPALLKRLLKFHEKS